MRNTFLLIMLLVVLIVPAGCGWGRHVNEQDMPANVLVFGFIEMVKTPCDLEWVEGIQLAHNDSTERPSMNFRTDGDGMFYLESVPLGSVRLTKFGGSEWKLFPPGDVIMNGIDICGTVGHSYDFPIDDPDFNELTFRLEKPGLHYVGSYKEQNIKKGFFSEDKYSFTKIAAPTERDLLKRLLNYTDGTKWYGMVNKRLAELERIK